MTTVYIDMDDVLADFVGAVCRLHNRDRMETEEARKESGIWDLGRIWGMSAAEVWAPIKEQGEEFWVGLDVLPWATPFLTWLREFVVDTPGCKMYVLSSPGRDLHNYTGKLRWLRERLYFDYSQCLLTSHKHLLAKPGAILIDDKWENVRNFQNNGGFGFHFNTYYQGAELERTQPGRLLQIVSGLTRGVRLGHGSEIGPANLFTTRRP